MVAVTAAAPCSRCNISFVPFEGTQFGLVLRPAQCKFVRDRGGSFGKQSILRSPARPAERECSAGYFCNQPPEFVVACASQSTGRGGSSRRLLGRRWRSRWSRNRGCSRSRRSRGGSRSRAWFTATVHHAHFSSAALADRGTHRGVPYTDAIDQLTPQTTSLANLNDRIVRLPKWDVRHTLCTTHSASAMTVGLIICFLSSCHRKLCR